MTFLHVNVLSALSVHLIAFSGALSADITTFEENVEPSFRKEGNIFIKN